MSKHSLRYTFNENKFNLKTIIYLFILIDFFLAFIVPFIIIISLIGYEASMIIGLMIGLKGQNKFKVFMFELRGIVDDPKYNKDEELRGHLLKQKVYHACLEWGMWFEKRLGEYGLDFKKKLKNLMEVIKRMNDKILEVIKKIDDRILESIGLWLVGILAIFTAVLGEWLYLIGISGFWILFILAVWDLTDALLLIIIIFYFKLKKEDNEPIPIGKVAIVKGKIAEIETKLQ